MNTDILKGKWNQMKGDIKQAWGDLTDDDLKHIEGDRDKLLGKLQERYGYTREQAETEWNNFRRQHRDWFGDVEDGLNEAAREVKNTADRAVNDVKNTFK